MNRQNNDYYDIDRLHEIFKYILPPFIQLRVFEVMLDRFPICLALPYPTIINNGDNYIDRYNEFYLFSQEGDLALFNLFNISRNYDIVSKRISQYQGENIGSTWAKFIECINFVNNKDLKASIKLFSDFYTVNNVPTDILIDNLNIVNDLPHIYTKLNNCSLSSFHIKNIAGGDFADVFYCDFSYYSYGVDLIESFEKPTIVVSRKGNYSLDSSKWETIDCGKLEVHHNIINSFFDKEEDEMTNTAC